MAIAEYFNRIWTQYSIKEKSASNVLTKAYVYNAMASTEFKLNTLLNEKSIV